MQPYHIHDAQEAETPGDASQPHHSDPQMWDPSPWTHVVDEQSCTDMTVSNYYQTGSQHPNHDDASLPHGYSEASIYGEQAWQGFMENPRKF